MNFYSPENKQKGSAKTLTIVIVILLVASFFAGYYFRQSKERIVIQTPTGDETGTTTKTTLDFDLFWDVWKRVNDKYYKDTLASEDLFYGSIKGMVEAVGDPYTVFMDPEETKQFKDELNGTFEGIGAEIGIRKGQLVVISPLQGSPAERAGLRPGDWIVAIDDKDTSQMTLWEAVDSLRGEKGTVVKTMVMREGFDQPQEFEIIRDVIKIDNVKYEMLDDGLAHMTISSFGNDTSKDFQSAVNKLLLENPQGIILDLRNNPGGVLDVAVGVAGEFMDKDKLVVIEKMGDSQETILKTHGSGSLKDIPLVILVNEGSASASEILAGALRDERGVVLVGEKTFGKGLVQDFEYLPQGTSLRVTIAEWLTPEGEAINEKGLEPDIQIELNQEDLDNGRDPQMEKAIESLR